MTAIELSTWIRREIKRCEKAVVDCVLDYDPAELGHARGELVAYKRVMEKLQTSKKGRRK